MNANLSQSEPGRLNELSGPAPNSDAEANFNSAMDQVAAGDRDLAIQLFRHASDSGHSRAAYMLAGLLQDRYQFAEAETYYRRALDGKDLPNDLVADAQKELGYLRSRLGDDQTAEGWYKLADTNGNRDATFNLGNLLARTGRQQEAVAVYRRAAAAGQRDAAYNLADILAEQGKHQEAEPLWRQAMAAGITDAINNLALGRVQLGDHAEAEALFRQAVAAGDPHAILNLGMVLYMRGALDEAETWLRQAEAAGRPGAADLLAQLKVTRQTDALLTDPAWLGPLSAAGFTPAEADLVRVVKNVMVAARDTVFSDGMPFLITNTAVLVVKGHKICIAFADNRRILVVQRSRHSARLMVSRFNALQIVWGNATVNGWTFVDLKVDTDEGQQLANTLAPWIGS